MKKRTRVLGTAVVIFALLSILIFTPRIAQYPVKNILKLVVSLFLILLGINLKKESKLSWWVLTFLFGIGLTGGAIEVWTNYNKYPDSHLDLVMAIVIYGVLFALPLWLHLSDSPKTWKKQEKKK